MDVQPIYEEREDLKNLLSECIDFRKKCGRVLANAEYHYKKARTMYMAMVTIDGYESEHGKTKPIAITAASDFVQGIPEVADLKLIRDTKRFDLEVAQEKIYEIKLSLNIIEKDLENIRRGM